MIHDMKKQFQIVMLGLATLLMAMAAQSQTVGSATTVSGINQYAVQTSPGIYQTNSVYFTGAYKSIVLSGISNTNETFVYWYSVQLPTAPVLAPGTTNFWVISGFITNSFAGGTNGGTFTTNFSTAGLSTSWPLYIGFNTGTYTNTLYVP